MQQSWLSRDRNMHANTKINIGRIFTPQPICIYLYVYIYIYKYKANSIRNIWVRTHHNSVSGPINSKKFQNHRQENCSERHGSRRGSCEENDRSLQEDSTAPSLGTAPRAQCISWSGCWSTTLIATCPRFLHRCIWWRTPDERSWWLAQICTHSYCTRPPLNSPRESSSERWAVSQRISSRQQWVVQRQTKQIETSPEYICAWGWCCEIEDETARWRKRKRKKFNEKWYWQKKKGSICVDSYKTHIIYLSERDCINSWHWRCRGFAM